MVNFVLDFEKPIVELEQRLTELQAYASEGGPEIQEEIAELEKKLETLHKEVYSSLSPWQRVLLARHQKRPYTLDYIEHMTEKFIELHGDRLFADDSAIVGGLAVIEGKKVILLGHQKGRDTKSNIYRNFGMANPEGYRKALRIMKLGAKFRRPVITLIDTPGAFPGKGSEERGIAEAIARNLYEMAVLPVPVICVVTGEGGSGGALGIAVGDRVLMLENAIYSVISPEGCASILFRDSAKAPLAAASLKLTAQELLELGLIDGIIPEPKRGAHQDHVEMAHILKDRILKELAQLETVDPQTLINERIDKFGKMGFWQE